MHRFQPSRGRIFFEVLCALAIAASCAGAWMQTGASALLSAAGVALLYGLVHLFDMRRQRPVEEPQRIDFEAPEPAIKSMAAVVEPQPAVENAMDLVKPVEAPTPRAGAGRRKAGSRKGSGRRAKNSADAQIVEMVPPSGAPVAGFEPGEADEVEAVSIEEASNVPDAAEEVSSLDEVHHSPVAPLFEPEPFVRQQRVMFGRKAR